MKGERPRFARVLEVNDSVGCVRTRHRDRYNLWFQAAVVLALAQGIGLDEADLAVSQLCILAEGRDHAWIEHLARVFTRRIERLSVRVRRIVRIEFLDEGPGAS